MHVAVVARTMSYKTKWWIKLLLVPVFTPVLSFLISWWKRLGDDHPAVFS